MLNNLQPPPVQSRDTATALKTEKIYRTLWRWHLYAGVVVAPIILWAAATGSLYIFVDEVEPWLYRSMYYADASSASASPLPLDKLLISAKEGFPEERFLSVGFFKEHHRTIEFMLRSQQHGLRHVYVNPYTAEVQGSRIHQQCFFPIVRTLHRSLYAGSFGRLLTELATGWGIVLVATGIYLWWPRTLAKVSGVWLPRLNRSLKIALRDFHAIGGMYLAPVSLVILFTGLFFTMYWGRLYMTTMVMTDGAPAAYINPPKSHKTDSSVQLSLQQVWEIAEQQDPDVYPKSISPPQGEDGVFHVQIGAMNAPAQRAVYVIDPYSGQASTRTDATNASLMLSGQMYAYPLHVGSIFGLPTKLLALLACLSLAMTSITGLWMWWRARPRGTFGFPRKSATYRLSRWIWAMVFASGILLPVMSASLLIAALIDVLIGPFIERWSAARRRTA